VSARGEAVSAIRFRPTGRALALAALVLLLLAAGTGVFRQYLAQRARIERLEGHLEAIEAERARLERRIELLNDPEHLERLARRCLGMVRPGEILFVVPEEKPAGAATDAPADC
jgi:cell division protein DivIC